MDIQKQKVMLPPNVVEAWPIFDTLVLCSEFFGQEADVPGWFANFFDFSQHETHTFFKGRTSAQAGEQYTNKESADVLDYAYHIYNIGVAFIAPSVRVLASDPIAQGYNLATQVAHFWEVEFPRYCGIEFKVKDDTVMKMPAMAVSPGYGPVGGGASFEHEDCLWRPANGAAADYYPVMNMSVTQGVPDIANRWSLCVTDEESGAVIPLGVPRTATMSAVLHVSEIGRRQVRNFVGDFQYLWSSAADGENPPLRHNFPARFLIQVSLFGTREVQSRGQYSR